MQGRVAVYVGNLRNNGQTTLLLSLTAGVSMSDRIRKIYNRGNFRGTSGE